MPPISGEVTAPVIETKKEYQDRVVREKEEESDRLIDERETQLRELTEIFRRRALIVNDFNGDLKIRTVIDERGIKILKTTVGYKDASEEAFYQPLVEDSDHRLVVLTDGTVHRADSDYLETVSLPTKKHQRFPLLPGIDKDEKVAEIGDNLPMDEKTTLADGRTVMPEILQALGSRNDIAEILSGLERTLKLANKLADGTVLHYGPTQTHFNEVTGLVPTS